MFEFDGIRNSKEDGFGHPSSKPVPLIAYLVKLSTQTNGIVLDGFLGSASTLMACEQTGRICRMMELDPKYASVILLTHKANAQSMEEAMKELAKLEEITATPVVFRIEDAI